MKLIKAFPDLPIHGSTQMTVHNLNGALELQDLGFKRVVLARELSSNEIDYICKNTNIEIECFIMVLYVFHILANVYFLA